MPSIDALHELVVTVSDKPEKLRVTRPLGAEGIQAKLDTVGAMGEEDKRRASATLVWQIDFMAVYSEGLLGKWIHSPNSLRAEQVWLEEQIVRFAQNQNETIFLTALAGDPAVALEPLTNYNGRPNPTNICQVALALDVVKGALAQGGRILPTAPGQYRQLGMVSQKMASGQKLETPKQAVVEEAPSPLKQIDRKAGVTERGKEMAEAVSGWRLENVKAPNGVSLADGVDTKDNPQSPKYFRSYKGGTPAARAWIESTRKANEWMNHTRLKGGYKDGNYYSVSDGNTYTRSDTLRDGTVFVFAMDTADGVVVEVSPWLSTKVEGDAARTGDAVFMPIQMTLLLDKGAVGRFGGVQKLMAMLKDDPRLALEMAQAKFPELFASKFENNTQVCYISYPPNVVAPGKISGVVKKI